MNYESYQGRGVNRATNRDRPVTYLPNTSEWVTRIYCLEGEDNIYTADKVLGGLDGVSNAPLQALANRTYYLYEQMSKMLEYLRALRESLSAELSNVKAVVAQKTEPADKEYTVWLQTTQNFTSPTFTFTLADNTTAVNPVLRATLEDGSYLYLRFDGISGDIPDLDATAFEDKED